jgi:hypothetical protein
MMTNKKAKPAKPKSDTKRMEEVSKRIKSIYSVDGKFRAQLVNKKEGGWVCEIWSRSSRGGRERPVLRNVKPFATMEEAVQLARRCCLEFTGDDRYFAKEDVWKDDKTDAVGP